MALKLLPSCPVCSSSAKQIECTISEKQNSGLSSKYEQAEEMHRQVLRLREVMLGKKYPDTLIRMSNLVNVLSRQGKYEQAGEMHRRILGLKEAVPGKRAS
jgi:hypothetical protein